MNGDNDCIFPCFGEVSKMAHNVKDASQDKNILRSEISNHFIGNAFSTWRFFNFKFLDVAPDLFRSGRVSIKGSVAWSKTVDNEVYIGFMIKSFFVIVSVIVGELLLVGVCENFSFSIGCVSCGGAISECWDFHILSFALFDSPPNRAVVSVQ